MQCGRATCQVCEPVHGVLDAWKSRLTSNCKLPPTADSRTLVTASADTTAKLWDMETGHCYFTFEFDRQGARGCAFSQGAREVVVTLDPFMGTGSSIGIYKIAEDRAERALHLLVLGIFSPSGNCHSVVMACDSGPCREKGARAAASGSRGENNARAVGTAEPHHYQRWGGRHAQAVGRRGAPEARFQAWMHAVDAKQR